MRTKTKKPWREYVDSLTPAQHKKMLMVLLEWQLDQGGEDVRFREAEPEDDTPAEIYWDSCGDSLLDFQW